MNRVIGQPVNLIMQAIRRGDGISYTTRAFFKDNIPSGQVVVLFSDPAVGTYYPFREAPDGALPSELGSHDRFERRCPF